MTNPNQIEYNEWLEKVDYAMEQEAGVTSEDLDDFCYPDAFDEGLTPGATATRALRNAGFYAFLADF